MKLPVSFVLAIIGLVLNVQVAFSGPGDDFDNQREQQLLIKKALLISEAVPVRISKRPLSDFCPIWNVEQIDPPGSEQTQPMYLGSTPKDMARKLPLKKRPGIPEFMRKIGVRQANEIRGALGLDSIECEIWPIEVNGLGSWVFSRWRKEPTDSWKWFDKKDFNYILKKYDSNLNPGPVLPENLSLKSEASLLYIFGDILEMKGLYDKPSFGDIVWTNNDGSVLFGAWLPLSEREANRTDFKSKSSIRSTITARNLPQPARFNAHGISFSLKIMKGKGIWPNNIRWVKPPSLRNLQSKFVWSESFYKNFEKDLRVICGVDEAVYPQSGKRVRFVRKNSLQVDHQLEDMADYLEERYSLFGLKIYRQKFEWRGIRQSNLIAVIEGSLPKKFNRPVLLVDHYDTAFAETVFDKTKVRVSVAGADDNGVAVAGLLRAAEELSNIRPRHDIWLVHLTGEEFPGDDLGARVLMKELRKSGLEISAFLLMDMIGRTTKEGRSFQINPGNSLESLQAAFLTAQVSKMVSPHLDPIIWERFDKMNYLYNTDGYIFEREGYPVVLVNGEMNRTKIFRSDYHNMTDTMNNVNLSFAVSVIKVLIQTTKELATR